MTAEKLKQKILNGLKITKRQAYELYYSDLKLLAESADAIRQKFCGNAFDVCSIINAKSGKCPENCKYCAQSVSGKTKIKEFPLIPDKEFIKRASSDAANGILRFSAVTSGRSLNPAETLKICSAYKKLSKISSLNLCASHGLMTYGRLLQLKKSGISRYHCNIETSKNYFPFLCTSHSYEDKIKTIKNAQKAGLEVCSGIIMGTGETPEDRIDAFFELKKLKIKSVPLNILNPVKGTYFENQKILAYADLLRTVSVARFILPDSALRLAGGRGLLRDKGISAFKAGVNAAISGDLLTTSGVSIAEDKEILKFMGFEIKKI